jgi:hypothetical protein
MEIKPPTVFTQAAGFTFGGGTAGSGPPKIEHRIGVQAPVGVVWGVLSDFAAWPEWNPLYPEIQGDLRIGSLLTMTLALPGEARRTIQPTIIDWTPDDQIHWSLSLMGGLVRSVRFLELEVLGEENCILSNGEVFGGLLGASVARAKRRAIRRGFTEMGEAAAARAESVWRARRESPISGS